MIGDDEDEQIRSFPEVALARHELGNRKTAVQMVEQLLLRVSDPATRHSLEERLTRFRGELAASESNYEKILEEAWKKVR